MFNLDNLFPSYNFTRGPGEPGESGCWMSFGNSILNGKWGDAPCTVDSIVRAFCMALNDSLSNTNRTRLIDESGLTWLPFGTAPAASEAAEVRLRRFLTVAKFSLHWYIKEFIQRGYHIEPSKVDNLKTKDDVVDFLTPIWGMRKERADFPLYAYTQSLSDCVEALSVTDKGYEYGAVYVASLGFNQWTLHHTGKSLPLRAKAGMNCQNHDKMDELLMGYYGEIIRLAIEAGPHGPTEACPVAEADIPADHLALIGVH